jgi:CubicO group peptidase (beta-lactamase class C family)
VLYRSASFDNLHPPPVTVARHAPRTAALLAAAMLAAACGSDPSRPEAAPAVRFADCVAVTPYSPTSAWRATCPPAANVDSALLRAAFVEAPTALPTIYSLLVVRHGYIVGENYYKGARATSIFDLRSVTKGVTSALVGAAIERGFVDSAGQRVSSLVPNYFPEGTDPAKLDITLRHLLSMESGWSPSTPLPRVVPYAAALVARPLSTAPGTQWEYDDGTYHVLAAALHGAVGHDLLGFVGTGLFAPLGITSPVNRWATDEEGIPYGSAGLLLTAREAAKIGELYLRDGVWDGQRLLADGWVDSTWVPRAVGGGDAPISYGYGWWGASDGTHAYHYALGYGGQFIVVVPDLDLVVVVTANATVTEDAPVQRFRALLRDRILPAVM